MTLIELAFAFAGMTGAFLALLWVWLRVLDDEPDPMDEEHGDFPYVGPRHD